MSRTVRSARGKMVDIRSLIAQNEDTRAVGNVPMNARGDRLDKKGNVKAKVEDVARVTQTVKTTPKQTAISDPVQIDNKPKNETVSENQDVPVVDEFQEELPSEPISKITRTRDDGTKFMEIEYEDGSMETIEVEDDETS